jgi:hypothetical protein
MLSRRASFSLHLPPTYAPIWRWRGQGEREYSPFATCFGTKRMLDLGWRDIGCDRKKL